MDDGRGEVRGSCGRSWRRSGRSCWTGTASSPNVEALAREHDEYRQSADRLAWELGELRAAHERLGHEHEEDAGGAGIASGQSRRARRASTGRLVQEREETQRGLVSLRAAHETLVRERQRLRARAERMQERHEAVMRERHRAGEELEAILRRFRASV